MNFTGPLRTACLYMESIYFNVFPIGCYRFSDSTFMKYLNYSGITPKLQIFAPIFAENGQCIIDEQFKFIRQGKEWKNLTEKIFSIKNVGKKITLKVKKIKLPIHFTN